MRLRIRATMLHIVFSLWCYFALLDDPIFKNTKWNLSYKISLKRDTNILFCRCFGTICSHLKNNAINIFKLLTDFAFIKKTFLKCKWVYNILCSYWKFNARCRVTQIFMSIYKYVLSSIVNSMILNFNQSQTKHW